MADSRANKNGQFFASPGVVIRKSVILKQPQCADNYGFARSSSAVVNSRLPSVREFVCQRFTNDVSYRPAVIRSEGL